MIYRCSISLSLLLEVNGLASEGKQSFLRSASQNKSCQNLFRKNNNGIDFTTHPQASSDSVSSAGVALANSYQST